MYLNYNFDLFIISQSIPSIILGIIVYIIAAVFFIVFWKKKSTDKSKAFFIGLMLFILYNLIIETALYFVLSLLFVVNKTDNIWLYSAFNCIIDSTLDTAGLLFIFTVIMRSYNKKLNSVSCAAGYSFAYIILTGIGNLLLLLIMQFLITYFTPQSNTGVNEIYEFFNINPSSSIVSFFSLAFNGILVIVSIISETAIKISLSVFVFFAVKRKEYRYFILAAIGMQAVYAYIPVLQQADIIPNFLVEIIQFCIAAAISFFAFQFYNEHDIEDPLTKQTEPVPDENK